jgi:hypothetical protein
MTVWLAAARLLPPGGQWPSVRKTRKEPPTPIRTTLHKGIWPSAGVQQSRLGSPSSPAQRRTPGCQTIRPGGTREPALPPPALPAAAAGQSKSCSPGNIMYTDMLAAGPIGTPAGNAPIHTTTVWPPALPTPAGCGAPGMFLSTNMPHCPRQQTRSVIKLATLKGSSIKGFVQVLSSLSLAQAHDGPPQKTCQGSTWLQPRSPSTQPRRTPLPSPANASNHSSAL